MTRKRKPIPVEPITVDITSLSHDGKGIARHNDKVIFVFGALPGENVKAKVTHALSRYSESTTLEVLRASPARNKALCPHFGLCGGCQLQHLEAKLQIQHKETLLKEQLVHAHVHVKEWLAPLQAQPFGYRQKARLGVRYVEKKQALLVGFREQNNNKLAMLEICHVLDPRVGLKITALREMIFSLAGHKDISQIEVAIGGDEVALVFRHLKPLSENDVDILTQFCKAHAFSLYLQSGGVDTVCKIWPQPLIPELTYELKTQNLRYHFHPLDFTQVNQAINQAMINQAIQLLNPTADDTILDLFCGLGNFSLPFAQLAHKVVGVEGSPQMVTRAYKNAALNNIQNVEFHACDLSKIIKAEWANQSYSKMIIDPPRSGALEIVNKIGQFKVKEILYISCNPATFARDSGILVQAGYHLVKSGVMDMFPQTAHVEVMGLFQKK